MDHLSCMHGCYVLLRTRQPRRSLLWQPDAHAAVRWSWTSMCSDCTALALQMLTQPQTRLLHTKSGTCQLQSSMAYGPALCMTPISRPACWLTPPPLCSSATGEQCPVRNGSYSARARRISMSTALGSNTAVALITPIRTTGLPSQFLPSGSIWFPTPSMICKQKLSVLLHAAKDAGT